MCLIAHRPVKSGKAHGSNIPTSVIDTAMFRHPDGFGVAWREGPAAHPTLKYQRFGPSAAERKHFRNLLREVDAAGGEYVAHFRWATHGPSCAALAHPYEYKDPEAGTVLVFHNGVIAIPTAPAESDTQVFVRDVLAHLPSRWWEDAGLRRLVISYIGGSRLVLMTRTETVNLTTDEGEWDGGLWYSSAHRPYEYTGTASHWSGMGSSWTPYGVTGAANTQATLLTAGASKAGKGNRKARRAARRAESLAAELESVQSWTHNGHALTAMKHIGLGRDGTYTDAVFCETCFVQGDVYVVDGSVFFDVQHDLAVGREDDDDIIA